MLQADEPLKESPQQIDVLITTHGIQVFHRQPFGVFRKDRLIQNKLKELLDARGKSLYWLAKMSGVGYQRLHLHYRNRAQMIRYPLEKICKTLKCGVGDVLEMVDRKKQSQYVREDRNVSETLEYGCGRSKWNNSVFGAPRRWMLTKDGMGVEATYQRGAPNQPDFFFSVVWQVDVGKSEKDDNPELARIVCLKVESPRNHEKNTLLNDLKRRFINGLLAGTLQSKVLAKGYGWNEEYLRRSDGDIRNYRTTTVFRVILGDSQIKATPKETIKAVHADIGPMVDDVLWPFGKKLETYFGR